MHRVARKTGERLVATCLGQFLLALKRDGGAYFALASPSHCPYAMLTHPLSSAEAYGTYLAQQDIPVLKRTLHKIALLGEDAESVNSRHLAGVVLGDPLMAMRLLSWMQKHRHRSQNRDITTIDRAIMMMGVDPFLNSFTDAPTLEDKLVEHPRALLGTLQAIARARKSAAYARDWAILRRDANPDEVTVATLLHEATEIMLWIFAPALMQRVENMLKADSTLLQPVAMKVVFDTPVSAIQRNLAQLWQLPDLLIDLLDPTHRDNPRVRNVDVATRFTRHLMIGWEHPAIRTDIDDLVRLLPLNPESVLQRVGAPPEAMKRLLAPKDA